MARSLFFHDVNRGNPHSQRREISERREVSDSSGACTQAQVVTTRNSNTNTNTMNYAEDRLDRRARLESSVSASSKVDSTTHNQLENDLKQAHSVLKQPTGAAEFLPGQKERAQAAKLQEVIA